MEVTSKQGKVLAKQDCVLGDYSGTCWIVLWEGDTGKLVEEECYKLSRVVVREYAGVKFLSMLADAEMEKVEDIGEVVECGENDSSSGEVQKVEEGETSAVISVDEYYSCINCKGKVKTCETSTLIGQCMKCNGKVKMSRCSKSVSARFVIANSTNQTWCLTAFGKQLDEIVKDVEGESIEEKLLLANEMKFAFNSGTNVVNCVIKN